jgi:hypothetical protein
VNGSSKEKQKRARELSPPPLVAKPASRIEPVSDVESTMKKRKIDGVAPLAASARAESPPPSPAAIISDAPAPPKKNKAKTNGAAAQTNGVVNKTIDATGADATSKTAKDEARKARAADKAKDKAKGKPTKKAKEKNTADYGALDEDEVQSFFSNFLAGSSLNTPAPETSTPFAQKQRKRATSDASPVPTPMPTPAPAVETPSTSALKKRKRALSEASPAPVSALALKFDESFASAQKKKKKALEPAATPVRKKGSRVSTSRQPSARVSGAPGL